MVHETRHHDYDHDEDYIPDSPPSSPGPTTSTSTSSSPKPVARKQQRRRTHRPYEVMWFPIMPGFPVLVISSWVLSALLYSAVIPFTAGDLAAVSRSPSGWTEIGALIAFRTAELAIGWNGRYDSYDLAALTLLTHTPYLFLLSAFYSIRPSTAVASLVIDVTSVLVPMHWLAPLSPAHDPAARPRTITNRAIISDWPVQIYVSALATAVYSVTLVLALQYLGLPTLLISRFDGLASLELAHSASLLTGLLPVLAPLGIAAKILIFTPATAARRDHRDNEVDHFVATTATLTETLVWNLWGGRRRTRVNIQRTATLAGLTLVHTWLHCVAHIAGTDHVGAAVYSTVWAVAAGLTGYMFWWVTDVGEVKSA